MIERALARTDPRRTRRGRTRALVVAGSCVTASLLAVSTAPAGAAAGSRTDDVKDGMSFILPTGWAQVSLDSSDIGALIGTASKASADLKSALSAQAKSFAEKGIKFFAVSPGATANVNVGIYDATAPLSELDVQTKLGLTSIGATNLHTKEAHFRFGWSIEATYMVVITSASTPVYGTQFYASHGGRTFITTFSSQVKSLESRAASAMMPTWRFTL
jgi:hypothetical protein